MDRESIPYIVNLAGELYSLPDICLQLRYLSNQPTASAEEMARLIATDPALTARLLKLANSAYYGFPATVSTVSRAITLIGVREMNDLAFATSAASLFKGAGGELIDISQFWSQSVHTAIWAKGVARQLAGQEGEQLFVAGLLHNIGKLVMLEQSPSVAAAACYRDDETAPEWRREQQVMGFTFAEVGGALLAAWGLPEALSEPVRQKHLPSQAGDHAQAAAILHVADKFSAATVAARDQNHRVEVEALLPAIDPGIQRFLGIRSEQLEMLSEWVTQSAPEVLRIIV
ncbi:MAG: HDOD domain-containing protein [Gammaproteobacteria bacterium]|nr:HDOD domain-containing protein [Gammaproteobacteria bacterium]